MPTIAGLIQDALPVLIVIAGELYVRAEKHVTQGRKAASALSLAVGVTQNYIDHCKDGGETNTDFEGHIAGLWDAAYNALAPIYDQDLQKIEALQLKAAYWENAEGFCDAGVDVGGMKLSTIRQKLRKYIRDTAPPKRPAKSE